MAGTVAKWANFHKFAHPGAGRRLAPYLPKPSEKIPGRAQDERSLRHHETGISYPQTPAKAGVYGPKIRHQDRGMLWPLDTSFRWYRRGVGIFKDVHTLPCHPGCIEAKSRDLDRLGPG